ncbi:uncharacterized protein bam isoform X2 [Eurosta solidaginis]|uniref:uncharacterized protein bam isoform X2 n=1 Tax=Eurosta solidaginis TaxID=178769 RepID=UPI003530A4F5
MMSLNMQQSGERASQLLKFNMEHISDELSALIMVGELDSFGTITTVSKNINTSQTISFEPCAGAQSKSVINTVAAYRTDGLSTMSIDDTAVDSKETRPLQLYLQYHCQQQLYSQQPQQNLPCNIHQRASYSTTYDVRHCPSVVAESQLNHRFGVKINNYHTCANRQLNPMRNYERLNNCIVTANVPLNHSLSPKFEFHFLPCQSSNGHPDKKSMPLISSAARRDHESEHYNGICRRYSGCVGGSSWCNERRKFMKQQTDSAYIDEIDYDRIVIDMSAIGLSMDKNLNPVLRLFGVFHKVHYFLNDVFPESFVMQCRVVTSTKFSMPCTMNVQYQVKQVTRKGAIFLLEMQRLLNTNRIHCLELYLECEQSLNMLRTSLTHFEIFKRVEMEHKRGQFVTEEAQVQSQKLEQLLLQLSDQIRETHIYVHAFNWAVEHISSSTLYSKIQKHQNGTAIPFEWTSSVPHSIILPSTDCDIISNAINDDVINEAGASEAILSSASNYSRGIPITTGYCSELDTERQSTRYIGYK